MTYNFCKRVITRETYFGKDDMAFKLDIFLMNDRITSEEYAELTELLNKASKE